MTSDPSRTQLVFDWSRCPRRLEPETLLALMADFLALGPIGFRGPAASRVPDHLTVVDDGIRTAQHISPGVRCRSNALIGDILDLTGEDLLFITSANRSSTARGRVEAAHYEMDEIRREFGHRRDIVLIGHDDEMANRAFYPRHLPCSTTISPSIATCARRRAALLLERHGSLGIDETAGRPRATASASRSRRRARARAGPLAGRASASRPSRRGCRGARTQFTAPSTTSTITAADDEHGDVERRSRRRARLRRAG